MNRCLKSTLLFLLIAASSCLAGGFPSFEDYPAEAAYSGEVALLNTDDMDPFEVEFMTYDAEVAPDFAGRYFVSGRGCGTECQVYGIADLSTGSYIPVPHTARLGVEYQPDSRLLIVNEREQALGFCGDDLDRGPTIYYYLMEPEGLKLLLERPVVCPIGTEGGLVEPVTYLKRAYASAASEESYPPTLEAFYEFASAELRKLMDLEFAVRDERGLGVIDFGVAVDGQDWRLTDLTVQEVKRTSTELVIEARFKNFDVPVIISYQFLSGSTSWRLDDLCSSRGWCLKSLLSDEYR